MFSQTNNHKTKLFHCMYCQNGLQQETLFTNHTTKGCLANEVQSTKTPEENEKMHFKNHYKKLKAPYVIYGDFECLTAHSKKGIKGCYQHHKPAGFMLNVVNSITHEMTPYLYRGEGTMKTPKDMIITHKEQEESEKSTQRFICNGKFTDKGKDKKKVRDHCHFTGKYRGAAHNKCNLDYCFRYFKIPVFFHKERPTQRHSTEQRKIRNFWT